MLFNRSSRLFALAAATLCVAQDSLPTPEEFAALGKAFETSQHANADWSFYEAPSNFSADLAPGSILKTEYATDLSNYTVPSGLSMSRIVYTTKNFHGDVIPASAYILWPYHALPQDDTLGYPIAAWAHGTSGIFRTCAPSSYRSLQYHFMMPYTLANQGMVVVAPDYAGLGVNELPNGDRILHEWGTTQSQANDIAYAIEAARTAFPEQLRQDGPFVTLGHSQGGRAAWGFAERQAADPVPGYRGTVAFAPPSDPVAQVTQAQTHPNTVWAPNTIGVQPLVIQAVTAAFPAYARKGLSDAAAKIFDDVYEPSEACLPTMGLVFAGVEPGDLARPGWTKAPLVQRWRKETAIGRKEFAGPMLVIQGASDGAVPYNDSISSSTLSVVQDTCSAMEEGGWTASLELVAYPAMQHFAVIQASQHKWLTWVKERLFESDDGYSHGCAIGEVAGFRTEYTAQAGPAPNFLVAWVDQTYAWQYAL